MPIVVQLRSIEKRHKHVAHIIIQISMRSDSGTRVGVSAFAYNCPRSNQTLTQVRSLKSRWDIAGMRRLVTRKVVRLLIGPSLDFWQTAQDYGGRGQVAK